MRIKAVLFDTGGVVVNGGSFSEQYQKKFGVSNDKMLPFFKGIFRDCLIGKVDLKEAVQPFLSDWKWSGNADDFLKLWFEMDHNIDQRIVEVVSELQSKESNVVFSQIKRSIELST